MVEIEMLHDIMAHGYTLEEAKQILREYVLEEGF